jgi:hypothetical protein
MVPQNNITRSTKNRRQEFNICAKTDKPKYNTENEPNFGCELQFDVKMSFILL